MAATDDMSFFADAPASPFDSTCPVDDAASPGSPEEQVSGWWMVVFVSDGFFFCWIHSSHIRLFPQILRPSRHLQADRERDREDTGDELVRSWALPFETLHPSVFDPPRVFGYPSPFSVEKKIAMARRCTASLVEAGVVDELELLVERVRASVEY